MRPSMKNTSPRFVTVGCGSQGSGSPVMDIGTNLLQHSGVASMFSRLKQLHM